ncbi:MAG: sulfite exporter TauE/SafE family protein [Planctomycetaceae bacterium]
MNPDLYEFAKLLPLGFCVGCYGTLVGAGGGSVLVPLLLVLLPDTTSPAAITSMSLAVVFFNAYAGTIAYMRMGRIDFAAGILFTVASLPGAVLGTLLVHTMPRHLFDLLFGCLLLGIGGWLFSNPLGESDRAEPTGAADESNRRTLIGSIGSAYIAVLSSLLGIGGGIIHVPFLIRVLRMPPHTATATSHFVLTFMALAATITHVCLKEFQSGLPQTMYLSVGVMMGAPLGATLSTRLKGSLIVRILALALCFVGLRLLARMF